MYRLPKTRIEVCKFKSGPTSASARPDWRHFFGAPISGMRRNFLGGHQVIMVEIMSGVKERGRKVMSI